MTDDSVELDTSEHESNANDGHTVVLVKSGEITEELAKGAKEAGESLAKELAQGLSASEPAGDQEVMTAFALGWQMSELYNPGAWPSKDAKRESDLPGLSGLGGSQRAQLGLKQVRVALQQLEGAVKGAGLDLPTTASAEATLPAEKLEPEFQEEIFKLHVDLLTTLTAAHFKLGKSYGLGRALADTTRLPNDCETLRKKFAEHRIATLKAWISDLTTLLPPHSGHSVNDSLAEWTTWANKQPASGELDRKTVGMLRRQGERWRALLSGEKNGIDNLEFSEYVEAGIAAFSQTRRLIWQFLRQYLVWIVLVLLLIGGSVVLVLTEPSAGRIAVGIAGLLASIGISWKGIGATLGKAATQIERPLWEAALDAEVAEAITLLPGSKRAQAYTPPARESVPDHLHQRAALPPRTTG